MSLGRLINFFVPVSIAKLLIANMAFRGMFLVALKSFQGVVETEHSSSLDRKLNDGAVGYCGRSVTISNPMSMGKQAS